MAFALSFINFLFAQEAAEGLKPSPAQNMLQISFMIFFFLIAMYLLFIVPKRSRDKQTKKMTETLKKNDNVMTNSGIFGTVCSVDKEKGIVSLRVDDSNNTKIRISVEAIYYVFPEESDNGAAGK